jgi:hypothetical protein
MNSFCPVLLPEQPAACPLPRPPPPPCCQDTRGTAMAGNFTPSRSQLFGIPQASPAQQGPARIEPVVPTPTPTPTPVTPLLTAPQMPNPSWWTGRRLRRDAGSSSSSSRKLQQQQQQPPQQPLAIPRSGPIATSSQFKWPYPQVTGERPPLGLNGVPADATTRPLQICNTRQFAFSMFWGPLLPSACGTYEVSRPV